MSQGMGMNNGHMSFKGVQEQYLCRLTPISGQVPENRTRVNEQY